MHINLHKNYHTYNRNGFPKSNLLVSPEIRLLVHSQYFVLLKIMNGLELNKAKYITCLKTFLKQYRS